MAVTKTRTNTRTQMQPKRDRTRIERRLEQIAKASREGTTHTITRWDQERVARGLQVDAPRTPKPTLHACSMTSGCHGNALNPAPCARYAPKAPTSTPQPKPIWVSADAHFRRTGTHSGASPSAFRWGF